MTLQAVSLAPGAPEVSEDERSEDEGAAGAPGASGRAAPTPPDPEVPAKPRRRRFSAQYKLRILEEAEACTEVGGIGRLLRREGLYSSHLTEWRRSRREGTLSALAPRKRGRKPAPRNPLDAQLARLTREKAALAEELRKARIIIDIQKKVAALLDMNPDDEGTS